MKKQILLAIALLTSGASTLVHAGGMGPVKKTMPVLIPFVAGEGMYTWPAGIEGYHFNIRNYETSTGRQDATFDSDDQNKGWGGRFAAGALHPMAENLSKYAPGRFSGSLEMGWGYYGRVDMEPRVTVASGAQIIPPAGAINLSLNQYGLDLLAGLVYDQPKYDLFFKVGGLVQNLKLKTNFNPRALTAGQAQAVISRFNGEYALNTSFVNVLPELRLGGGYRFYKNWLFTASWMHAFGSTFRLEGPNVDLASGGIGSVGVKVASPSLNTAMFGFEYRFAS